MLDFLVHNALVALIALAVDAVIGDPDRIWRRLLHPVAVMGLAIAWADRRFNDLERHEEEQRRRGVLTVLALVVAAGVIGVLVALPFSDLAYGILIEGAIASILIAQKSLRLHVRAVRDAFAAGGLEAARQAVSMIVGRDPKNLDEAGVSRAAIESAAENFSDGVVAPTFWLVALGLPGLLIYKAVNTADSMIGHKTERHRAFGWAAARLDDLLNLPASRLAGGVIALAARVTGRPAAESLEAMRRDAGKHASPNAGWPEAAFGGALGLALGGPRIYSGVTVEDPWMNAGGRKDATPDDISAALKLLAASCWVHGAFWVVILLLGLLI